MQVNDLSGNNYKNYFDQIRPINGCSLFLPRVDYILAERSFLFPRIISMEELI